MAKQKAKRRVGKHPTLFEVWSKYEEVAMHFNDLLLKIRTQALGVIATLITIVGIFAKTSDVKLTWEMSAGAFFFLGMFWIAIWVIDFKYYNRLLLGAVLAIIDLEIISKKSAHVKEIKLSQEIERAVRGDLNEDEKGIAGKLSAGRWWFYSLVFAALLIGLVVSLIEIYLAKSTEFPGGV